MKTVDVRSDRQASSCGTWPFAVSTSGSIDRWTIRRVQGSRTSGIGKALFLTLKKALEQGMIGGDKDFSGKVCVKWKDTEFERLTGTQRKFDSAWPDAIHAQATAGGRNRSAADEAVLEQPRSRQTPQEVLILWLVT